MLGTVHVANKAYVSLSEFVPELEYKALLTRHWCCQSLSTILHNHIMTQFKHIDCCMLHAL